MLLGIPGDNTYSNYQEATRVFWRATVLPLVERTAKAFAAWLSPAWGSPLSLKPDIDAIEALSGEREALWKRLEGASFLTIDEKRAAIGYGPMEGGAQAKYNADQPRVPAGENTYSITEEATRVFWRATVQPLVERTAMSVRGVN